MCRTSHCEHPKNMAPLKNDDCCNTYANRLDHLKRVLKPYRDNNANCLRLITRSARVNLNKHWKSLENLFAAGHDRRSCDRERAQNVANEKLQQENVLQEDAGPERTAAAANLTSDTVDRFQYLRVSRG